MLKTTAASAVLIGGAPETYFNTAIAIAEKKKDVRRSDTMRMVRLMYSLIECPIFRGDEIAVLNSELNDHRLEGSGFGSRLKA